MAGEEREVRLKATVDTSGAEGLEGVAQSVESIGSSAESAAPSLDRAKASVDELGQEKGDIQGLDEAFDQLEKGVEELDGALGKTKSGLADIKSKLAAGDVNGAAQSFLNLKGNVAAVGPAMLKAAGAAAAFTAGLAALNLAGKGVSKFFELLGQSTRLAQTQEVAVAKLNATLEATGGAAQLSSEQLQANAAALEELTGVGDEVVLSMNAILLTFKEVKGDNFTRASKAIVDMSVALDTDLKSAAIQVGKALNDPVKGISALARSGIQFSNDQQAMIRSLVETGQTAKAQTIILAEMEGQFGGLSDAVSNTTSGAFERLKAATGTLLEQIGAGLNPVLRDLAEDLTEIALDPQTIETFRQLGEVGGEALRIVTTGLKALLAVLDAIANPIDTVSNSLIRLVDLIPGVDASAETVDNIPNWRDQLSAAGETAQEAGGKIENAGQQIESATSGIDEAAGSIESSLEGISQSGRDAAEGISSAADSVSQVGETIAGLDPGEADVFGPLAEDARSAIPDIEAGTDAVTQAHQTIAQSGLGLSELEGQWRSSADGVFAYAEVVESSILPIEGAGAAARGAGEEAASAAALQTEAAGQVDQAAQQTAAAYTAQADAAGESASAAGQAAEAQEQLGEAATVAGDSAAENAEKINQAAQAAGEGSAGYIELADGTRQYIDTVEEAAAKTDRYQAAVDEIGEAWVQAGQGADVISGKIAAAGTATSEAGQQISQTAEKVAGSADSFGELGEATTAAAQGLQTLASSGGTEGIDAIASKIGEMKTELQSLGSLEISLPEINTEGIATSLTSIRDLVTEINGADLSGLVGQLGAVESAAASALEKLRQVKAEAAS